MTYGVHKWLKRKPKYSGTGYFLHSNWLMMNSKIQRFHCLLFSLDFPIFHPYSSATLI